jgi:hypothetical protein
MGANVLLCACTRSTTSKRHVHMRGIMTARALEHRRLCRSCSATYALAPIHAYIWARMRAHGQASTEFTFMLDASIDVCAIHTKLATRVLVKIQIHEHDTQ